MRDDNGLYTASYVSNILGISVKTLNNWYKWFNDPTIEKPEKFPNLPSYYQEYTKGPRFWSDSDIMELKKFKEWLPHGRNGVMGRVSEQYWPKNKKEVCNNNDRG